ncbi:MAG: HEPN domain-containing protein [Bacteroidetes bacterium]|nr:MAG: HEPN domain-containing protein [Bacteroidota bacterium]
MKQEDKLNLVNYKREKAKKILDEIDSHIKNNFLATAMNRIYYAGFNIITALMLIEDFSSSKHSQLIGKFNKDYIHSGIIDKEIADILNLSFRKRTAVDYHDFTIVVKDEVQLYYKKMKKFVKVIDEIIEIKLKTP